MCGFVNLSTYGEVWQARRAMRSVQAIVWILDVAGKPNFHPVPCLLDTAECDRQGHFVTTGEERKEKNKRL